MAVAQTAMVIALQSIPWHFSRAVLAGSFSIHELQALALTAKGLAAPSNHVTTHHQCSPAKTGRRTGIICAVQRDVGMCHAGNAQ